MSNAKKAVKKPALSRRLLLANTAILEQRVELLEQYNQRLVRILIKHLPSIQSDIQELDGQYGQQRNAVDAAGAKMLLTGYGINGVAAAAAISTEEEKKAYESKLVHPISEDGNVAPIVEFLEKHLTLRGQKGDEWIDVASAGLYDSIVRTDVDLSKTDITSVEDALYHISVDNFKGFILRLKLSEGSIMLFSPMEGLAVLTYSPMEESWIKHNNSTYLDVPVVLDALNALFAKANVHDVSTSEIKRLAKDVVKVGEEAKVALGLTSNENGLSFTMAQIFEVHVPVKGEPQIKNKRDDIAWEDLSLPTRRLIWRELVNMVATSIPETPAKKVTKIAKK